MSQPIRGWGGHLVFPIRPKNTNLVEDVEILHPVKFRWIPFSGFREEVENVKVYGRRTLDGRTTDGALWQYLNWAFGSGDLKNVEINTKRFKFQDFNICPNILHAHDETDADANTRKYSNSSSALKWRRAKNAKRNILKFQDFNNCRKLTL